MTINRAKYNSTTTIESDLTNPVSVFYIPNNNSPGIDAFGRLRVSTPKSFFQTTAISDQHRTLFWSSKIVQSASWTHLSATATCTMLISGTVGDYVAYQTKPYMHYEAGNSLLVYETFNFSGSSAGIHKKVGYFDDKDGYYLELSGGCLNIVERTSVPTGGNLIAETRISQSNWNLDRFDGSGPTGANFNISGASFLSLDFEWLGVGSVRMALMDDNGEFRYIHRFDHANVFTQPYIRTPNLPLCVEISASQTVASKQGMEFYCATVKIENGSESSKHIERSKSRGISLLATGQNFMPIMQVRLKDNEHTQVIIDSVNIACDNASAVFEWSLNYNPTFNGIGTGSLWTSVVSSSIEYDIIMSQSLSDEGIKLAGGYGLSRTGDITVIGKDFVPLTIDINGNKDIISLLTRRVDSNTSANFYGSISWKEYL